MLNYGESTSFSGRLCENLTGLASSQSGFGWCLSRIQSLDPFQLLGMLIISSLQLYPIRVCMVCKYLVRYTNKWSSTNDERLSDAPDKIELIWSCFMTLRESLSFGPFLCQPIWKEHLIIRLLCRNDISAFSKGLIVEQS